MGFQWLSMAFMALRYVRLFWNFAFLCCEEICVAIDSPGGHPKPWNIMKYQLCWTLLAELWFKMVQEYSTRNLMQQDFAAAWRKQQPRREVFEEMYGRHERHRGSLFGTSSGSLHLAVSIPRRCCPDGDLVHIHAPARPLLSQPEKAPETCITAQTCTLCIVFTLLTHLRLDYVPCWNVETAEVSTFLGELLGSDLLKFYSWWHHESFIITI